MSNDAPRPRRPSQVESDEKRLADEAEHLVRAAGDAMIARFNEAVARLEAERAGERELLEEILKAQRDNRARGEARSQLRLEAEAERAAAIVEAEEERKRAELARKLELEASNEKWDLLEKRVERWVKIALAATPLLAMLGGAAAWVITHWK